MDVLRSSEALFVIVRVANGSFQASNGCVYTTAEALSSQTNDDRKRVSGLGSSKRDPFDRVSSTNTASGL
ncbi:hypothetical protein M407DRAFT_31808 [Tulasnella calospora MUT 4182]|uniref:Uncharacterized protein n=1 Tax=Tulasnella calospora MUT 4182 TaxID=1051891 RepID=A0A0C3Q523_9AGAM|nr:hypothetical protein M407DRAFT_31808 [Tulasnella calospora MUT 4182]